jgi:hypothetical protein
LIDSTTHAIDTELLRNLGVLDFPAGTVYGVSYQMWEWLLHCRTRYQNEHQTSAKWDYLEPSAFSMPSGWRFLEQLTGTPNAKLSARFLERIARGEFVEKIEFGHRSVASYPKIHVPHPLLWFMLKHGRVQVGSETVRLAAIFARRLRSRNCPAGNNSSRRLKSLQALSHK